MGAFAQYSRYPSLLGCRSTSFGGSVYVYRWDGLTYQQETQLTASDGHSGQLFGQAIAVVRNALLIGAPGDDDKGSAAGSCISLCQERF